MKKIIISLMTIIFVGLFITGCGNHAPIVFNNNEGIDSTMEPAMEPPSNTNSINVKNFKETDLVYDPTSRIIYIVNYSYMGNKIYTPYIGPHGKYCKYENGQIIELD